MGKVTYVNKKVLTPELTLKGKFAKCWVRREDKLYLYRRSSNKGKESKVEVLCSDILNKLGINHVKYLLNKYENIEISQCENMTTENVSLCDISEYETYCQRNGIDFESWLENQELYHQMHIADYFLDIVGRHYGILYDTDTGTELKLAPLYDFKNAFRKIEEKKSLSLLGIFLKEFSDSEKNKWTLDISNLEEWLNTISIKLRFLQIFGNMRAYKQLKRRIQLYKSLKG